MPGLENFMLQTAGQVAGTGMGLLLADENDRRQLRQQEKLQKLGIKGSKEMTDYSYKKQMEMWKNTNYGAQMEELAKAGLNPGLLYGMGGQGGMTTGKGAENVDQGKAPQGGGEAQGMGLMGAQMALLAAQTEKTKAETANISGEAANQPLKGQNLQANTAAQKAQEENTRVDSEIKKIAASVSRQTINEQMKAWEQLVQKNEQEIIAKKNANQITAETMEYEIYGVKVKALGELLKNNLTIAETANKEAETKAIAEKLLQGWTQLSIAYKEARIKQFTAEYQANHPGVMNALGGAIQRIADGAAAPSNERKMQ